MNLFWIKNSVVDFAALKGNSRIVEKLLDRWAEVEKTTMDGETALHAGKSPFHFDAIQNHWFHLNFYVSNFAAIFGGAYSIDWSQIVLDNICNKNKDFFIDLNFNWI